MEFEKVISISGDEGTLSDQLVLFAVLSSLVISLS